MRKGEPTGILREAAQDLVLAKVPPPTPAQRRRAAELALADAARWGITSAQDNSRWEDFLVYEDLEREGKLTLRISEWLRFNDPVDVLEKHRAHHPANDPMLHTAMLKGFMDGSLGSRTAALLAPYSDDPGNSGLPQYEQAKLNRMAVERVGGRLPDGLSRHRRSRRADGARRLRRSRTQSAGHAAPVPSRRTTSASASSTTRSSRPISSRSTASWASSPPCSPAIC